MIDNLVNDKHNMENSNPDRKEMCKGRNRNLTVMFTCECKKSPDY